MTYDVLFGLVVILVGLCFAIEAICNSRRRVIITLPQNAIDADILRIAATLREDPDLHGSQITCTGKTIIVRDRQPRPLPMHRPELRRVK